MNNKVELLLKITDSAMKRMKKLIAMEDNPNLKFRIYIVGGGCNGFKYNFAFDDKVNDDDYVTNSQGIELVIDPMSLQYLVGGEIDYEENIGGSRFIIINPNAKSTCSCGLSFNI